MLLAASGARSEDPTLAFGAVFTFSAILALAFALRTAARDDDLPALRGQ